MPERIASIDITDPPKVIVSHVGLVSIVLDPGEGVDGRFLVHVEQEALQCHTYTFTVKMTVTPWIFGTIGFWKKWNKHKTYTKQQIEEWLDTIDAESLWLGTNYLGLVDPTFATLAEIISAMESKYSTLPTGASLKS
ncbi:MAG: hypothetical protein AB1466_00455 [Actinomycetota bacterium]